MAKHYIRVNENNDIVYSFSSDFENPQQNDICVNENGERHFQMILTNDEGLYKYKYFKKKIIEKTQDEIYTKDILNEKEKERLIKEEMESIRREDAIQRLIDKKILNSKEELIK